MEEKPAEIIRKKIQEFKRDVSDLSNKLKRDVSDLSNKLQEETGLAITDIRIEFFDATATGKAKKTIVYDVGISFEEI